MVNIKSYQIKVVHRNSMKSISWSLLVIGILFLSECGFFPTRKWCCDSSIKSTHLIVEKDRRLSAHVITSHQTSSKNRCAVLCLSTPFCQSAQFFKSNRTCELNVHKPGKIPELDHAQGWAFLTTIKGKHQQSN